MGLPEGKTHRRTDAGIARGPGIAVAGVTAVIVFLIGQQLFPMKPKQAEAPPAPPPVVQTPAPQPVTDAGAAAATTPSAIEAGAVAAKTADAGAAATAEPEKTDQSEKKDEAAEAEKASPDAAAAGDDGKPIDKQRQADKDLAREAWRRNRPDVSVTGNKTSILVPIRGSIKGSDFKIVDKRRKVVVTLPKAVSMVTMKVYNLKHPSFKKVWIDQDEANAQPADGTKLRFILSQAFDPQVEITEDFVRVTIRRPESSDAARPEKSEKRSERPEKRSAEKHSESSDDGAAPDKAGD